MTGCKSVSGISEGVAGVSQALPYTPEFVLEQVGSVYAEQEGIAVLNDNVLHINVNLTVTSYTSPVENFISLLLPRPSGATIDQHVNLTVYQGVGVGSYSSVTAYGTIIPGSDIVTIGLNMSLQPNDVWHANFHYIVL